MYKYKLYKPRKNWFSKLVWVEDIHRDKIGSNLSNKFDDVINNYEYELNRWSMK